MNPGLVLGTGLLFCASVSLQAGNPVAALILIRIAVTMTGSEYAYWCGRIAGLFTGWLAIRPVIS